MHGKNGARSAKDEFSARVRRFFDTAVLSQLYEAALKDALKAPTEFEAILQALQRARRARVVETGGNPVQTSTLIQFIKTRIGRRVGEGTGWIFC